MPAPSSSAELAAVQPLTECERIELLISRGVDGELSRLEQTRLNAHLLTCSACRKALSTWTSQEQLIGEGMAALWEQPPNPPVSRRLRRSRRYWRWLPLSVIAAPILALLGLGIYFMCSDAWVTAPQHSNGAQREQSVPGAEPALKPDPLHPQPEPPSITIQESRLPHAPPSADSGEPLQAPLGWPVAQV